MVGIFERWLPWVCELVDELPLAQEKSDIAKGCRVIAIEK